jgi:uncharacterized spore protein YtfJ
MNGMKLEELESLIKTTLSEIEKMLTTKTVVGEPITVEGNTIIPLISIGFGFGGGGGKGTGQKDKGEGIGAGTGGAGSVKPVGVVVVSKEGVKLETVKGPSLAESLAHVAGEAMARREKKEEKKEE